MPPAVAPKNHLLPKKVRLPRPPVVKLLLLEISLRPPRLRPAKECLARARARVARVPAAKVPAAEDRSSRSGLHQRGRMNHEASVSCPLRAGVPRWI